MSRGHGSAGTANSPSAPADSSATSVLLERFIEVPRELREKILASPSTEGQMAIACTRCGRWVPFEFTESIPDVAPTVISSQSVLLQDAVFAKHLPASLTRRSARIAARVISQKNLNNNGAGGVSGSDSSSDNKGSNNKDTMVVIGGAQNTTTSLSSSSPPSRSTSGTNRRQTTATSAAAAANPSKKLYMPNPQCFQCNWSYCRNSDADFLEILESTLPASSAHQSSGAVLPTASLSSSTSRRANNNSNESEAAPMTTRRSAASQRDATASHHHGASSSKAYGMPLLAQCFLCQKWRRIRRPHPSQTGFCCPVSPYAESRSCAVPENIEWLSDILQSTEKLRSLIRQKRKKPNYLDPKSIREARHLLHHQRVGHAPALFGGVGKGTAGAHKDDAIDVDQAGVLAVSRVAGGGRRTGGDRTRATNGQATTSSRTSSSRSRIKHEVVDDNEEEVSRHNAGNTSDASQSSLLHAHEEAPRPVPQKGQWGGRRYKGLRLDGTRIKPLKVKKTTAEDGDAAPDNNEEARPKRKYVRRKPIDEGSLDGSKRERSGENDDSMEGTPVVRKRYRREREIALGSAIPLEDPPESYRSSRLAARAQQNRDAKLPIKVESDDEEQRRHVSHRSARRERAASSSALSVETTASTTTIAAESRKSPKLPTVTTTVVSPLLPPTPAAPPAALIKREIAIIVDDIDAPSVRRGGRRREVTKWLTCDQCDKWRIVAAWPSKKEREHWRCSMRTEIPTSCEDPEDTADREEEILRKLGVR